MIPDQGQEVAQGIGLPQADSLALAGRHAHVKVIASDPDVDRQVGAGYLNWTAIFVIVHALGRQPVGGQEVNDGLGSDGPARHSVVPQWGGPVPTSTATC